jgi:fructokinase
LDGQRVIGVDVGGTKIEAIALEPSGHEVFRKRVWTPRGDYEATIAAVNTLVREIGTGPVGVGIPGTLSRVTGRVKNANSTWLIGRPLKEDLERALERPVRIENDANCFALAEGLAGAGSGHDLVFGVILGTGVGGGIAIGGQPLVGANAIAGEWGHNPLPWPAPDELPGPSCYCGRRGCIETFLSGPALAADHSRNSGQSLTAPEIAAAAERGNPECRATLGRYAHRLARGLASVINLLDPDAIVLGGGLSAISALYEDVPTLWGQYVFSDRVVTRLLPPVHGDSSGVRGAAWLWPLNETP